MLLAWIILFSLLGSVGAILIAALFLLLKDQTRKLLVPYLIAYATGTLLTAALLGLIPHALKHISPQQTLGTVLIGIVLFFILEKILVWRHCHDSECIEHHHTTAPLILLGDAFHNAADGLVIAASFLVSVPLGIAVGLSVIAHEIPQEVGDFAILLHSGYSREKALLWNILSGLATLPVAIASYYALAEVKAAIPYVMAISAASFLYIALVDVSPELHRRFKGESGIIQVLLMIAGIATMLLIIQTHP